MSTIVPFANEDPDKLFICPYDPVHTVRACRFNQHLRKCRKNHGGAGFKICTFNHSHHIPDAQYERHLHECPDKGVIQQDIDAAQREYSHSLPPVDHHPVWNKPESTEDWDSEVQIEREVTQTHQEINQEHETVEDDLTEIKHLLPEFPPNWENMTHTQKKNYRRKYKKQQDKMKELGLTPADFEKSKDPSDWTDEERQAKLDLMISLYPPPKVGGTFIDYKSSLNQYCQKNKINCPKYSEAPATFGGFAAAVIVNREEYRSKGVHKTKKDASQNAAKWALMAMDVLEEEQNSGPSAKLRPARTAHELEILRSRNEVGRLHNFDPMQPSARPVQPRPTQPRAVQLRPAQVNPPQPSNIVPGMNQTRPPLQTQNAFSNPGNGFAETMKALSIQSPEEDPVDGWHTVGSKKPLKKGGQGKSGRGRGTALSPF